MSHEIKVLDCTLRDGGYINNWNFGWEAIKDMFQHLANTRVEYLEVGFIENVKYNQNQNIFVNNETIAQAISPKNEAVCYVGMIDVKETKEVQFLGERMATSVDAIRVIFKKELIQDGLIICQELIKLGYIVLAQVVGTDEYTDLEFIELINRFNTIDINALYIVDSFGLIKKSDFIRLVQIADHNLKKEVAIGYHAHNNLQQAFGNAVAFTELGLQRDIIIDACVMGMGRGAGNLNMELFAEHLNEHQDKNYNILPMLEVIDNHLNAIYADNFWGYSLPFYFSAHNGCHPNYAKFFEEKGTLSAKSFNEILKGMNEEDKRNFTEEKAEIIYAKFLEHYIEDSATLAMIKEEFADREILIIAPGGSVDIYEKKICQYIEDEHPLVVSVNFIPKGIDVNYTFVSNAKRYELLKTKGKNNFIITSNIQEAVENSYMVNFTSFACDSKKFVDSSLIMFLNLLVAINIKKTVLAGADGYNKERYKNYIQGFAEHGISKRDNMDEENNFIKDALKKKRKEMEIKYLTPSIYDN